MKTYKLDLYGQTFNLVANIDSYANNDSLAICLNTDEGEPFAVITVNIAESSIIGQNQAFVDTNNCSWAEKFIKKYKLGKPTGIMGYSGFCSYPLYEFNLEAFK